MANTKQIARGWGYSEWVTGRSALTTDGESLWSYGLLIGVTIGNKKVLANYRSADGGQFVSKTTSKHVSYAADWATDIVHPEYFKKSGFDK